MPIAILWLKKQFYDYHQFGMLYGVCLCSHPSLSICVHNKSSIETLMHSSNGIDLMGSWEPPLYSFNGLDLMDHRTRPHPLHSFHGSDLIGSLYPHKEARVSRMMKYYMKMYYTTVYRLVDLQGYTCTVAIMFLFSCGNLGILFQSLWVIYHMNWMFTSPLGW